MNAAAQPLQVYAQPLVGQLDGALRNCLIGSAALGLLALLVVFLAPAPPLREASLDEMPERYAKLILEQPAPVAAPPAKVETVATMEMPEAPPAAAPAVETRPKPAARPQPKQRRPHKNKEQGRGNTAGLKRGDPLAQLPERRCFIESILQRIQESAYPRRVQGRCKQAHQSDNHRRAQRDKAEVPPRKDQDTGRHQAKEETAVEVNPNEKQQRECPEPGLPAQQ